MLFVQHDDAWFNLSITWIMIVCMLCIVVYMLCVVKIVVHSCIHFKDIRFKDNFSCFDFFCLLDPYVRAKLLLWWQQQFDNIFDNIIDNIKKWKGNKHKGNQTFSCCLHGSPIEGPSDHHSTVVLRGALNWAPVMPHTVDVSLSSQV